MIISNALSASVFISHESELKRSMAKDEKLNKALFYSSSAHMKLRRTRAEKENNRDLKK